MHRHTSEARTAASAAERVLGLLGAKTEDLSPLAGLSFPRFSPLRKNLPNAITDILRGVNETEAADHAEMGRIRSTLRTLSILGEQE